MVVVHGDNFEVISTTSYLERNVTKEPYANFYFLASIDEGMTDYGFFFLKIYNFTWILSPVKKYRIAKYPFNYEITYFSGFFVKS